MRKGASESAYSITEFLSAVNLAPGENSLDFSQRMKLDQTCWKHYRQTVNNSLF